MLDCCRFMQTRASKTKASVWPKRGDGDGLKAGLLIPTRGERADEEEHSSSEKTTGVLQGEGKREGRPHQNKGSPIVHLGWFANATARQPQIKKFYPHLLFHYTLSPSSSLQYRCHCGMAAPG